MTNIHSIPSTLLVCAAMAAGCGQVRDTPAESVQRDTMTPDTAFERLTSEGLTCELQAQIIAFTEADRDQFAEITKAGLSAKERTELLDGKEANCANATSEGTVKDIGTARQAVTGTYSVVFIPEVSGSGGYYPTYLSRDSAFYGWMCNSGSAENPADWILEYHVPGAYSHRSSLKIRGTNSIGSYYTHNPTASRVYSDDDIRTCVGYWEALLCGVTPTTYETVIWW